MMSLGNFQLIVFVFLTVSVKAIAAADVYIVYMGSSSNNNNAAKLLRRLTNERHDGSVLHTYTRSFSGFAARLSEKEAKAMAGNRGVVSVFREPVYKLQTTHSWDFLQSQNAGRWINSETAGVYPSSAASRSDDTIIGVIDTGKKKNTKLR